MKSYDGVESLNAICPYFTMFPLSFPSSIIEGRARVGDIVVDPFCGRGTTNFAARLFGLPTFGFDLSPVAVAAAKSKLVTVKPTALVAAAEQILSSRNAAVDVPTGLFWELAYHPETLAELCAIRSALISGHIETPVADALRGLILGALHGPVAKKSHSYFSNQCPRTYAPKPGYAVKFWRNRGMLPARIKVVDVLRKRASRFYGVRHRKVAGAIYHADAREMATFSKALGRKRASFVITSPPYYGLRTYGPDQWLRSWFLGGPSIVDYSGTGQIDHASPEIFAAGLRKVWRNVAMHSKADCRLVMRFGAINTRPIDAVDLAKLSLKDTGWKISTLRWAGSASDGKRQADTFLEADSPTIQEFDLWCRKEA